MCEDCFISKVGKINDQSKKIMSDVAREIDEKTIGNKTPEAIFLAPEKWLALREYLDPIVAQSVYGGHLASEKAFDEGYSNFMFKGVAICLKKNQ
jgi:hypothetical protein